MKSEYHRRSCFVIASPKAETSRFLEVLRKYNCEPFFISDYLHVARSGASTIRSAFKSVDFVVALVFSHEPRENVFFELGLAMGLGRRILLFAEPGIDLPVDVAGVEVHYALLRDTTDFEYSLRGFLQGDPSASQPSPSIGGRVRDARSPQDRKRLTPRASAEIALLREILNQKAPQARGVEAQLLQVFSSIGITAVEAPPTRRQHSPTPDIAVWLDSVQREIGNPVAIEVKLTISERELGEVVNRLALSLRSVDAKAGILLYLHKTPEAPGYVHQADPLIFVMSIDEFLRHVGQEDLDDRLKHLIRSNAGS